ncbi:hypothetical protein TNCV_2521061 [Trichonephila clavipes]|nr:hypothetical protein TNCV_2521061 [Trichonephila clavipes]
MFCWHGSSASCSSVNILANQIHPAILYDYPDGYGYFMDDIGTIYRVRSVQNRFAEHQSDFQHFPWPSRNPDLNPMENVKVRRRPTSWEQQRLYNIKNPLMGKSIGNPYGSRNGDLSVQVLQIIPKIE